LNDHPHVLGEVPMKGLAQFEQPLLLVFAFGQPGELLAHLRQHGGHIVNVRVPFGGVMLRGQQDAAWRGKPAEILYHFDSSWSPRREVRYPCKVWCYPLMRPVKCQPAGPSRLWRGERSASYRTGPSFQSARPCRYTKPGVAGSVSQYWFQGVPVGRAIDQTAIPAHDQQRKDRRVALVARQRRQNLVVVLADFFGGIEHLFDPEGLAVLHLPAEREVFE